MGGEDGMPWGSLVGVITGDKLQVDSGGCWLKWKFVLTFLLVFLPTISVHPKEYGKHHQPGLLQVKLGKSSNLKNCLESQ